MPGIKRYHLENHAYHLTSATEHRLPIFKHDRWAATLVDAILFLRGDRAFVLAYVVMPDHFHILVSPRGNHDVSKLMQTVKGYTARLINESCHVRGQLWQKSFHDRVIRGEQHLLDTAEYIHNNPVKAGLVASASEYRYSSAAPGAVTDLAIYLR